MKNTPANNPKKQNRASKRSGVREQRMARPPGGAEKDAHKEAWMAGARAGTEIAYDLMMAALKNMGRTLGIKKRKRPSEKLCNSSGSGASPKPPTL